MLGIVTGNWATHDDMSELIIMTLSLARRFRWNGNGSLASIINRPPVLSRRHAGRNKCHSLSLSYFVWYDWVIGTDVELISLPWHSKEIINNIAEMALFAEVLAHGINICRALRNHYRNIAKCMMPSHNRNIKSIRWWYKYGIHEVPMHALLPCTLIEENEAIIRNQPRFHWCRFIWRRCTISIERKWWNSLIRGRRSDAYVDGWNLLHGWRHLVNGGRFAYYEAMK